MMFWYGFALGFFVCFAFLNVLGKIANQTESDVKQELKSILEKESD